MTTSTIAAIRDRVITVIAGLTPTSLSGNKFVKHRNEQGGDFMAWAVANPQAAFRRFQVRDMGNDEPPATSAVDVEERQATLQIIIAYPQTNRTGPDAALDRDDVMDQDWGKIDLAIGMCGKANFTSPFADATPLGASSDRISEEKCDFLVITQAYIYQRTTG